MPRVRHLSGGASAALALVALLALLLASFVVSPRAGAASPSYRFYATQGRAAEPVRWNPCRTITYKINTNGVASKAAVSRVRKAVAEAAKATGITIRYLGGTSFVPRKVVDPVPTKVGAAMVITWARAGTSARRSPLLSREPRLAGVGGYGVARSENGFELATSGFVVFNAGHIFAMSTRKQYVVALHEVGHALGLDDVSDRRQVMNAVVLSNGPTHYADGDKQGLRRVGRSAGCLAPAPAPKRPKVVSSGSRVRIATPKVTSVSGPVTYALSSPELGGEVAHASTPEFSLPLATFVRHGRAGRAVRFQVRAANKVGATASLAAGFQVPPAVLTSNPRIEVTPNSLAIVRPRAVLKGTSVDVTDELQLTPSGAVEAFQERGRTWTGGLHELILFSSLPIHRFEVDGTVAVAGAGLRKTFDVTGSYATSALPEPTDDPTDLPTEDPTDLPSDDPTDLPTGDPTDLPSGDPTDLPTGDPTDLPSSDPTDLPTGDPTDLPTGDPTDVPSDGPTDVPTDVLVVEPSDWSGGEPGAGPSDPADPPAIEPGETPALRWF